MRRHLVLLIVGALLSTPIQAQVSARFPAPAAASAGPTQTVGDYNKIRTVAVLSGIGSTVTVQKQRTIGVKRTEFASADWGIDSFVVSRVREYLGDRFMFKNTTYDVRAMGRLPSTVLRDTNKTVRAFFNTVPKDVDAYIVVRRQSISRAGTMSRSAPGLAFYDLATDENPKREDGDARPIIVANYAIDVLSPARLDVIASAAAQIRYRADGEPYFAELIGDPDLKTNDGELSDPQRERLRSDFERLLSISLADTLRALDLGANLPPPLAGTRRIVPLEPAQDPLANIRTVGIASAIGDRFHLGNERSTVADNSKVLPIPDWGVDGHIEDVARRLLSQRFEVKEAIVDRTALPRSTVRDGHLNFNPILQGVEPTSEVDAYVLFLKFPMPLGVGGYEGLGLGLFNREATRSQPGENALFAHYAIVVVDARSLKMIRAITGTMSPEYLTPRPTREIDRSLWADSAAQLSADQKEGIKQSLFGLLDESIEDSLLRIGFTGNVVLYPPGIRPEECWPGPSNAGAMGAMAPMYVPGGGFAAGAAAGALGYLMTYAANQGTAIGRLPMLVDEKGLVC